MQYSSESALTAIAIMIADDRETAPSSDGEPVTEVDELKEAEYRILELTDDTLEEHEEVENECPELEHNDREDLENFCLYRDEDGFCSALETQCVLQADD